jgi:RNA polymerase sigma-70 factor (ECF subfamily)
MPSITLAAIAKLNASAPPDTRLDVNSAEAPQLDHFLRGVERRALRMAELATGNREEALDLLQESMFGFVRHYATKPAEDWPALFYRVLDSRLNDWHRRQRVRGRHFSAWDEGGDAVVHIPDAAEPGPLLHLAGEEAASALQQALAALPHRQRQTFLLRIWEGLDVAATAAAMRCSEGSVKTHLSRALANLRQRLETWNDR